MEKIKSIVSILLLLLFGVALVHSSVPHKHHHDSIGFASGEAHTEVVIHENHHHHKHSESNHGESFLSFLDELIHNHEHQGSDEHTSNSYLFSYSKISIKSIDLYYSFECHNQFKFNNTVYAEEDNTLNGLPLVLYEYLHPFSDPLRGPPLIVS